MHPAILMLAVGLGLLCRLGYSLATDAPAIDAGTDGPSYASIAKNLLGGAGFVDSSHNLSEHFPPPAPTSFWSPGYPVFIYLLFRIGGADNFTLVKIVQAVLSTITCILVHALALRLFCRRAAGVGLLVACFYPAAIFYANVIGTETLFALLVLLGVLTAYAYVDRPTPWSAACVGAAWGAGVLTNAVALAFVPWVGLFLGSTGVRLRFRHLGIAAATFLLLLAPWALRNTMLHGRLVVVPTKGAFNLLVGSHAAATGGFAPLDATVEAAFEGMTEIEMTTKATAMALGWIGADTKHYVALVGPKVARTWTPYPNARRSIGLALTYLLSYGVVLLGAAATAVQRRWCLARLWLPYALCLSLTVVVSIYFGAGRFRFPLDALLIVLASPAILQALRAASRFSPAVLRRLVDA